MGDNNKNILLLSDIVVSETKKLINEAKTEEDLRIGFEKILEPVIKELGVKLNSSYEKSVLNAGRVDALHGQVIIEYEKPFSFSSPKVIDHAYQQLISYIQQISKQEKETLFLYEAKFIGVGFDGEKIFFVRYKGDKTKPKYELEEKDFILIGPFLFNQSSCQTLLSHLRALSRVPLTAENLANKFGSGKYVAEKAVSAFCNALKTWGNQAKIQTFFNEWRRLFGIVYGESLMNKAQEEELKILQDQYNISANFNFQEILFSLHTYFAFLMKLIVAEILNLKETSFFSSLSSQLTHISDEELKQKLETIEDGGVYREKGITNFLEGDFFRWYLEAYDSPELRDSIREITRCLSEFEPATSILDESATRDLLKKLYQYLVPKEIRHRLGEYYTPDWLAELLLNEVGYDGNNFRRLLDPACGSGTFLVLAIQRAKKWGKDNKRPPLEIGKSIKANIWGFDLNPLAVIAARTNYLFAMGELVDEILSKGGSIEIPIYLADSVLWPTKVTEQTNWIEGNAGNSYIFPTSIGKFYLPSRWLQLGDLFISMASTDLEMAIKNDYSSEEIIGLLKSKGLLISEEEKNLVKKFYEQIVNLHKQNKDGVWIKFLKNLSMPLKAEREKFDFVVGNPPWIRWGYLSEDYRKATFSLWRDYGLFPKTQDFASRRLGGGEKDFSMLFTYASADYYLKDGAKLGFLITQEVFKSKGAGEGFRHFKLGKGKYLKVLKVHDLVSVQPFEGAVNKTTAIILKKSEKTEYPLPYFVWTKKKGIGKIATDKLLDEVLLLLQRKKLRAQPIGNPTGSWQTIAGEQIELAAIEGENPYKARRGASTEPYGVFWLEVKQVLSDGNVIVRNLAEKGKRSIPRKEATIESDLIYPAVRGSDIKRWGTDVEIFVLITHKEVNGKVYSEQEIKRDYPRTFGYLTNFRDILLSRGSKFLKNLAERTSFFTMFGIGDYTFAKYRVMWKRMASDIIASVVSQVKTPFGYKTVIGTDTTALFATNSETEAHYLCAIINSKPVRDFIKSFSSAGRGFGTPSVMEHVGIPKFDPKNPLHLKLSEVSKKCHQLKAEGKEKEIEKLEKENDELVKELFGINY